VRDRPHHISSSKGLDLLVVVETQVKVCVKGCEGGWRNPYALKRTGDVTNEPVPRRLPDVAKNTNRRTCGSLGGGRQHGKRLGGQRGDAHKLTPSTSPLRQTRGSWRILLRRNATEATQLCSSHAEMPTRAGAPNRGKDVKGLLALIRKLA